MNPSPAHYPSSIRPDMSAHAARERLENRITELAAHIAAATYELLVLIGRYDAEKGWVQHGMASCANWLQWRCGTNPGAAREKVRVARALPGLPQISAAFREGRVSYSKVRAMTRVATPENERCFLNIARYGTARQLCRSAPCARFVRRVRPQGGLLQNRRGRLLGAERTLHARARRGDPAGVGKSHGRAV